MPFQAHQVPVNREYLRRAANRGEIQRIVPGVYIAAAAAALEARDRHLQRALAYQMSFPTPIVASHETAAAALELPLSDRSALPRYPRFSLDPAGGSRRHKQPRVKVVPVPAAHAMVIGDGPYKGLRVTTPERTALDLASELTLPFALMVLDAVARRRALAMANRWQLRGDVDPRLLRASTAGLWAVEAVLGQRFSTRRRAALALTDPRHESPAESASVARIHLAGFPAPVPQVRFATSFGNYYADLYWEPWRVVAECDGKSKYRGDESPAAHRAADERRINDKRRALAMEREHELTVVPWFAEEAMYRPEALLAPLEAALRAGGPAW